MNRHTTFRSLLIKELSIIAASEQFNDSCVQVADYTETRIDLAGEICDYYTGELLAYEDFNAEFDLAEIDILRKLVSLLDLFLKHDTTWANVQVEAWSLLERLRRKN